ncbi:MAG: hypothetical protein ABIP79_06705, partial [Chitinophagaceae bacterium]
MTFSIDGGSYGAYPANGWCLLTPGEHCVRAKLGDCVSPPTCITIPVQPICNACSYTQGFWGNKNGFKLLNTSGILTSPLIIGGTGPNTITITGADITKLNNSLPGGGKPGPLASIGACNIANSCFDNNYLTKQKRINNNLLSQTITLSLNVRLGTFLNTVPIMSGCLKTSGGSYPINQSVVTYLTCKGTATVSGLLALANAVLGGSLTPGNNSGGCIVPEYSAINDAVDAINNAFDECKDYLGYGNCSNSSKTSNTEITAEVLIPSLKINAFPNPYENGQFNLRITAPETGNALIQLFTLDGNQIAEFKKPVFANKEEILNVKIPGSIQKTRLIYQVTLGKYSTKGFVLSPN